VQFEVIAQLLQKHRLPAGLVVVGLFLFSTGLAATLGKRNNTEVKFETQEKQITPTQASPQSIVIDIGGAVETPGVYEMPSGSRIKDAVFKAGGLSSQADQEQVSLSLNLAAVLSDGQKIIIPSQLEESRNSAVAGTTASETININSSSQSELESLSGIGPVRAAEIISNRPYGDIKELVSKKILGQTIYDKIKDQISVY